VFEILNRLASSLEQQAPAGLTASVERHRPASFAEIEEAGGAEGGIDGVLGGATWAAAQVCVFVCVAPGAAVRQAASPDVFCAGKEQRVLLRGNGGQPEIVIRLRDGSACWRGSGGTDRKCACRTARWRRSTQRKQEVANVLPHTLVEVVLVT